MVEKQAVIQISDLVEHNCLYIAGRGVQLVQKKRTIYPEWNTCFDAHLYDGRVINLVVMEKPNKFLAEITISARALAEKCTDGNIATAWVNINDCLICINWFSQLWCDVSCRGILSGTMH